MIQNANSFLIADKGISLYVLNIVSPFTGIALFRKPLVSLRYTIILVSVINNI